MNSCVLKYGVGDHPCIHVLSNTGGNHVASLPSQETVERLLERGANPDFLDHHHETAEDLAKEMHNYSVATMIRDWHRGA